MKRTISLILVILLIIPLLSACGGMSEKKEPPTITYTNEILINRETPPDELKWYIDMRAPTQGAFVLELTHYSTYATLDATEIQPVSKRDCEAVLEAKVPFRDTFLDKIAFFFSREYEKQKHDYTLKVLGMTAREFDRKIGKHVNLNSLRYYSDCVIGVIRPLILQKPVEDDSEYAGKNILVYYDYEDSVVIPYTDEELKAENDGRYVSSYTGRIGDRFYLTYGYYDITEGKLFSYQNEDDLPPHAGYSGVPAKESPYAQDNIALMKLIKKDPVAKENISDYIFLDYFVLLGDRYYAVIAEGNRYYGESIDDYEGEDVFLVTVDATTGEVLYLQKFHLDNYWGFEYKLFSLGEDGILYDVMMP